MDFDQDIQYDLNEEEENEMNNYMGNLVDVNRNLNSNNQIEDIKIPSLYQKAKINLRKEMERKKKEKEYLLAKEKEKSEEDIKLLNSIIINLNKKNLVLEKENKK